MILNFTPSIGVSSSSVFTTIIVPLTLSFTTSTYVVSAFLTVTLVVESIIAYPFGASVSINTYSPTGTLVNIILPSTPVSTSSAITVPSALSSLNFAPATGLSVSSTFVISILP